LPLVDFRRLGLEGQKGEKILRLTTIMNKKE